MGQKRAWTDQEILDALKAWAEKHGRSPKWSDWKGKDPEGLRPTNMTVWARCGSWHDALLLAGLEPNVPKYQRRKRQGPHKRALRLREQGLTLKQIGEKLGVSPRQASRLLEGAERRPRKPRNATERREARIAALKKALGDGVE